MPNPVKVHPASLNNPTALDWIVLDLSGADVDLTDPAGPTGGYCARAVLIGSTGGNLIVDTLLGTGRVIPVAANQLVEGCVKKVYSSGNGTSADKVLVGL